MFFVVFSFDLPRSTGILLIRRSLRWNVSREWKRRMGRKSRVEGGKAEWKTGTKNLFSLFFIFSFAMGSRCFGSRWHRTSPRSTGRRWTLRVLLSTSFTTLKPNSLVSGFFKKYFKGRGRTFASGMRSPWRDRVGSSLVCHGRCADSMRQRPFCCVCAFSCLSLSVSVRETLEKPIAAPAKPVSTDENPLEPVQTRFQSLKSLSLPFWLCVETENPFLTR